jgi:RNA exonuclease 1
MERQDGGWSVVESRSSRNKRRKIEHESDGYPSISFYKSKPERVDLKALQDLVLYVLADGVAPTWLAVNKVTQITKAVVLMVPGLDRGMLDDSKLWNSASEETKKTEDSDSGEVFSVPSEAAVQPQPQASVEASLADPPSDVTYDAPPTSFSSLQADLLKTILEVRAPGDSSMSRVHSPLQGMLVAPFSSVQKTKGGKGEKAFQPNRTPIAAFVHSADELRDAEYPIHPAAFDDPRDARLEQERREKTGQSTSSGWVDTDVTVSKPEKIQTHPANTRDPLAQGLRPYALDCEMVLTTDDKYSLARISVVDWSGHTILDKFVKPSLSIKDYFTEFSGVTEEILKHVTTTLKDIQDELLGVLGKDSILLGHSLESDLNALKLTHPFIVDTSIIYPHPRGLPLRSSLKFLANRYLRREIQKGGLRGHDSVEDARAVLDLVKLKCLKGPKWGTSDANGESIFRRVNGAPPGGGGEGALIAKTSAIVEFGTPERGLGKEATYHIACEDDNAIVEGILRAACGDSARANANFGVAEQVPQVENGEEGKGHESAKPAIPIHGVDFVWSRLHDLEAVRRWNDPPSGITTTAPTSAPDGDGHSPEEAVELAKGHTLRRILRIYASLPPHTLFIVYSGTSDMRPLLQLQALHAQYKREFKVKKWDELSVKWTDTEEQAMKKACEEARRGIGIVAVTLPAGGRSHGT